MTKKKAEVKDELISEEVLKVEAEAKEKAEKKAEEEAKKKAEAVKDSGVKDEKAVSAKVYSRSGQFIREYTEEHTDKDKGFVEKARGYAKKIGGRVELA